MDRLRDVGHEERELRRLTEESNRTEKQGHACPVPKPGGFVGEILGFRNDVKNGSGGGSGHEGRRSERLAVVVERGGERAGERKPE